MLQPNLRPSNIIYSGSKVQYLYTGEPYYVRFIDSMFFIPASLASLPKTFGFEESKKGYFPHHMVLKHIANYVGPYFPHVALV